MNYRGYLVDSEGNKYYPEVADTGWIEPELMNGAITPALASKGKVRYRKYGKLVQIIGSVKGIDKSGTDIFILPEGFRPTTRIDAITAQTGARWYRVHIAAGGNVNVETSSDSSYNADRWIAVDCMFLVD